MRLRHPRAQRHRQERHAAAHHRPDAARQRPGVRPRRRDQRADGDRAGAGAAADRVPVSERGAVRLDLGRRERRVSDAAPHQAAGPRDPRSRAPRSSSRSGSGSDYDKMPAASVGRHAQARRPGARDGARSADPAGRRAERRPRSDHRRRDRRAAARASSTRAGTTLVVVTHNIPSARGSATSWSCCTKGGSWRRGRRPTWSAATTSWCSAFMSSQHAG